MRTFLNLMREGIGAARAAARLWLRPARVPDMVDPVWEARARDAVASPDNQHIPRCEGAGRVSGRWLRMHNGVEVLALGYYGGGMTRLLTANRGVHEPQEERVFQAVLGTLREDAVIVELGAFWGFYALWFLAEVPRGRAVLVEPRLANLIVGQANFRRNRRRARFVRAYAGEAPGRAQDGTKIVSVDSLAEAQGLDRIDLLHADIQGAEVEMLRGCARMLANGAIGYIFLSTHGAALHRACVDILKTHGFHVIAEASPAESYSVDGLIVARAPNYPGLDVVAISRRGAA